MKRKTQLGKRLASTAMAVVLAGSTMAGTAFPAYGELNPDQTFGKEPITAVVGGGTMVSGLSLPGSVLLADEQADACAAQLFAYLKAVGESPYVLYGHQNDTHHKGGEDYPEATSSDTKDITGSIAAIVGIDALSFTGAELPLPSGKKNSVEEAAQLSIQAAREGAIMTLSAHMPNFSLVEDKGQDNDGDYDYSGYTPGNTKGDVMSRILPGGDLHEAYNGYLDLIADYGLILQAQQIPVLFRPLHENNGSWFWWGAAFCDEEGYKNVYRYTVEYLRDVRNVHNFLYVYSPGGPFEDLADFESRYPGDAYVDVIGFDMYHDNPSPTDTWIQSFAETVLLIDQAAQIHGKIPVVAETGMRVGTSLNDGKDYGGIAPEGNARPLWFSEIQQVLAGTNIPYYMVWANWDGQNNFYSPYKTSAVTGHEMVNAFIDYYNDPATVFANGTNFYGQVPVPTVEKHGSSGYILAPASGDRILYPMTIRASLENASGDVSFVLNNKEGSISRVLPAKAASRDNALGMVYEAQITQEDLKALGKTTGTIDLVAGGSIQNTINAIFSIKEAELDPLVVDDFENYLGDSLLLLREWATNSGSGCNVEIELADGVNKVEKDYGMAFRYTISENGNGEGWAGATKPYESNLSGCNAMQLWIKPDGKGQKLVIQLTSNGEDFEVHLPEFAATTEGKYVTVPFAAMKGKNGGTFDPANVSSFGIWCNTINPAGSGAWQVDSVLYVDDIHMVNTDSAVVEYLDARTNADGSAGSGVTVIRNTMEAPLLWYGPGFAGMKSLAPEPVTVTTLYQGTTGGTFETSDTDWLMNSKDTDYVTFVYNCSDPEKAGWSVMGWGATVNGEWTDGPRYNAPSPNTLQDTTIMVSIKELKTVLGIERGASVSYLNLGTWNDGNLKSVTLTKGDVMPGRVILENVPANYTYETNDVGWIVDAPDDKYINLVITCDHPKHSDWEIMGWGASVGEDWVEGPKYTAWKPASHEYAVSYTVKRFKELLGVTPEKPLTYIKLGSYNDGRIVRLSLDDTKMPFVAFYSWLDRHPNAKRNSGGNSSNDGPVYQSPNAASFRLLAQKAEDAFAGNLSEEEADVFTIGDSADHLIPANWGQLYLDDLGEAIAQALKPGKMVAVKYSTSGDSVPALYPMMEPSVDYATVSPVWSGYLGNERYALFTLDSFTKVLKRSLIPADIAAINLAGGNDAIIVEGIVVMDQGDVELVDESSRLTEKYGQHPLKLTDYHAGYEQGDEVTVTITLDRAIKGHISADVGGVWNAGSELSGKTFTRTFTPDGEGIYVSANDFLGSDYAEIVDVKVDISGKVNYDQAVTITADPMKAMVGGTSEEIAAAVGADDEEVKAGTKVEVVIDAKTVSQESKNQIQSAAENLGQSVTVYSSNDITAYLIPAKGSRTQVNSLQEPMLLRFAVPEGADLNQNFAVARIGKGSRLRAFSARAEQSVEWLPDLDDKPETITVETDQLGEFVLVAGDGLEAEGLHTFEKAWGGNGDENATYQTAITRFCPEFELGDTVEVTAVFNKESNVKFMIGSEEKEIVGRRITFEIASYVDDIMIQAGDESKLPLKLLDLEIALVKKAEKGDEIHTFAKAWDALETSFDEYFEGFESGKETKVVLTFDQPVRARVGYNDKVSGGWAAVPDWEDSTIKASTTLEVTIIPNDHKLNIEITDMNGNSVVKLMDVKVEQENNIPPQEEMIEEFKETGVALETSFGKYMKEGTFASGKETRVTLTFDKAVKAQIGYNDQETDQWATIPETWGDGSASTIMEATITPKDDYLNIQISDMNGNEVVKLLTIVVEQESSTPPQEEIIEEFKETGVALETSFGKYMKEGTFASGKETRVTLTFDKAVKAQIGYNDQETDQWATVPETWGDGSASTIMEATITPKDDYLNIQISDMNGNEVVKLLTIVVEQESSTPPQEEIIEEFKETGVALETSFGKYMKEGTFASGKETKVTLTFDKAVKAQIGYNDQETDQWATVPETWGDGSASTTMEATITPRDDYLNIQISNMNGNEVITLISIEVSQDTSLTTRSALKTHNKANINPAFTETKTTFDTNFAQWVKDDIPFTKGQEVTITVEFDQEVEARISAQENGEWVEGEAQTGKSICDTFDLSAKEFKVSVLDMMGNEAVNVVRITIELGELPEGEAAEEESFQDKEASQTKEDSQTKEAVNDGTEESGISKKSEALKAEENDDEIQKAEEKDDETPEAEENDEESALPSKEMNTDGDKTETDEAEDKNVEKAETPTASKPEESVRVEAEAESE